MPTAAAAMPIPAIAAVDRSSSDDGVLKDAPLPVDVDALDPAVADATATVKSDDLYNKITSSAETVKAATPDTEILVESTLTHVRPIGSLGPKLNAVVEEGHSGRPLTIMVFCLQRQFPDTTWSKCHRSSQLNPYAMLTWSIQSLKPVFSRD